MRGHPLRWAVGGAIVLVAGGAIGVWRRVEGAHQTVRDHAAQLPSERARVVGLYRGRPALSAPVREGEAAAVMASFLSAVDAVPSAVRLRFWPYADPPVPPEELDGLLAANPEPMAALEHILAVPATAPAEGPAVDALQPHWTERSEGNSWLSVAVDRAMALRDVHARMRVCLLAVAYAHEAGREGGLFFGRDSPGDLETKFVRRLLKALGSPGLGADSVAQVAAVLDGLERSRASTDLVVAVRRVEIRSRLVAPGADEYLHTYGRFRRPDIGAQALWSWRVLRADTLDRWDVEMDEMRAALAGSETAARAAVTRAYAIADRRFVLSSMLGIFSSWLEDRETGRAWALVARAVCALTVAAGRIGTVPRTLEELVPQYISAVPIDPWSGKPLRYEDGRVWSVGPDGVDDGGTPVEPSDRYPKDLAGRVPTPR